jgi:hypothetical protein
VDRLKNRRGKLQNIDLGGNARECFLQLFLHGPTWDGDIVSKAGRGELFDRGYAARENGWSYLTTAGMQVALAIGLDADKEKRDRDRRRVNNDNHRALYAMMELMGATITIPPGAKGGPIERERQEDGSVIFRIGERE